MFRRALGPGLLLTLGVGAIMAATALAQSTGPQARPLVVGVIDIGVVFKNYKRKDDLEKQINAHKERLEKQAQSQREEIQKLRKNLDLVNPGSPTYRIEKYKLLTAMKTAEVNAQAAEEELKSQVEALTLQLLDEIEETVRDYGQKSGYDLILKIDTKGWGDEKFQERIFRAQVSAVLYHDTRVDVTQSVLAVLNDPKNIQKHQSKGAVPGVTGVDGGQRPK
jgi:Skp family chaperone for outer membrane proteins